MRRSVLALVLCVLASAALAQAFGPFKFVFGGGGGGTIAPPPPSCAGVIDLSVGCIIPGVGP